MEFEGEYLNGKRNGKGKEYSVNKLIFEGGYLNGEINGKAKEYNLNDNLRFQDEFKDGKILKAKAYDIKQNMLCHLHLVQSQFSLHLSHKFLSSS